MDTLQAAILLAKLTIFEQEVRRRAEIGTRYSEMLKQFATIPCIETFNTSVYAQYTIEVDNREKVIEKLNESGTYGCTLSDTAAFTACIRVPGLQKRAVASF